MEVTSTIDLCGTKGTGVRITAGSHLAGINVEIDYSGRVTTYTKEHFADVLIALALGVEHIENLPGYCQCEPCRNERGKAWAERIAAAQKERENKQ